MDIAHAERLEGPYEELREAGVDLGEVQVRTINLMKGEQFANDFTARNPNQKIPVLRDGDLDIFEELRDPSVSRGEAPHHAVAPG